MSAFHPHSESRVEKHSSLFFLIAPLLCVCTRMCVSGVVWCGVVCVLGGEVDRCSLIIPVNTSFSQSPSYMMFYSLESPTSNVVMWVGIGITISMVVASAFSPNEGL